MCTGLEPMVLASLAASAGGAAINSKIQNNTISETNRQNQIATQKEQVARDAEIQRQRAFEAEQAGLVTQALMDTAPEAVVEKATAAATDESNPIVSAAEEYNVPALTGQVQNEDVNDSIGSTIRKAMARTKGVLTNAALLDGQNTGLSDNRLSLGRLGSEVQTIGSNRAGSGSVAQYETRVPAASVTASGNPLGDLLMLGGSIGAGQSGFGTGAAGGIKPFELGSIFNFNKAAGAT